VVAYVLATTAGDDAIICSGPVAAAVALQSCGDLARRADASGETIMTPGPDHQLAAKIAGALRPVSTARATIGSLGGDRVGRATKATAVARAETGAIEALKRLGPPARYQPAITSLTTALQREETKLTTLANEARANNATSYPAAVRSVTVASHVLAGAAAALASYQLGVPTFGALRLAGSLPTPVTSGLPPVSSTTTQQTTTSPPPVQQNPPQYTPQHTNPAPQQTTHTTPGA
jgi:hypothetical protein